MGILLAIAAVVCASLGSVSHAVPAGPAVADPGQQPAGLFVEADLVSGVPGPSLCVLQSRFAPGDRVVFRARVFDVQTGQVSTSAAVTVHFADGSTIPLFYGRPQPSPHLDYGPVGEPFWANVWIVPEDAPPGIIRYTIEAAAGDQVGRFMPLNVEGIASDHHASRTDTPAPASLKPRLGVCLIPPPAPVISSTSPSSRYKPVTDIGSSPERFASTIRADRRRGSPTSCERAPRRPERSPQPGERSVW